MNEDHEYNRFENVVILFFDKETRGGVPVFTTDAADLFDLYLMGIPEEHRQHYNCNACKGFINRYGGLVKIDENGVAKSVVWDIENTPEFFKPSVRLMLKKINASKVNGVFIGKERGLGQPKTNGWSHIHCNLHDHLVNSSMLKTAGQMMAEKKEDHRIFAETLAEYDLDTAEKAVSILSSAYRADRFQAVAKWFVNVIKAKNGLNGKNASNFLWLTVATAPIGNTHIKNTVVGTMMQDIKDGLNTPSILARFNEMVNPGNYMRSQSEPTTRQVESAESVVKKLGIERSLERRYARFDELDGFFWKPVVSKVVTSPNGVFANVKAKVATTPEKIDDMPKVVMTWSKFLRTVVPSAKSIEAEYNQNRFVAVVAPKNTDAPNIIQWDNGYSWYYHGGVDVEMRRRVINAGGQYDNTTMRCSLMWNNGTDLDLHCVNPWGHIYYGNKRLGDGWLDVDANGGHVTSYEPVENIRWNSNPPNGHYKFYVHNYSDRNMGNNPFTVELQVGDKVFSKSGFAGYTFNQTFFEFDYLNGQILNATFNASTNVNRVNGRFVKVTGIVKSPNLWGENPAERSGNHVFFILDGVKDEEEGKGRGFFNEMLKPELREIRKTLEAYTSMTPIEGADTADACGVGYSAEGEWNLRLKVDDGVSVRLYKIDRYD